MSERRCRWCWRTVGEIRAIIEAQGREQPMRLFDRSDAWARCVLCKPGKSGYRTTPQQGGYSARVKPQHVTKSPPGPNRSPAQKPTE